MKRAWIASSCMALLILADLLVLDLAVKAGHSGNLSFTETAILFYGFIILFTVPIWIMILVANRFQEKRDTVLIGLGAFLLFLSLTAFPVATILGIWLVSIKNDQKETHS